MTGEVAAAGGRPLAAGEWGKDHWTLLLYLETRAVDRGGKIDPDHMRTRLPHHSMCYRAKRHPVDGTRYGTIVRGGAEQADHDDWDCVRDLEAAGLLWIEWDEPKRDTGHTGLLELELEQRRWLEGRVRLTTQGWRAVSRLRRIYATQGRGPEWDRLGFELTREWGQHDIDT